MALAVGDIMLATYKGTCFGQTFILTHTYFCKTQTAGAITDIGGQDLLLSTWGAVGAGGILSKYAACLNTSCTVNEAAVQKIKPTRIRRSADVVAVVGSAGTGTTANVAAAITLRTDLASRSGISTKHVGPAPTNATQMAAGQFDATYKALLDTFGEALLDELSFSGATIVFAPCVFHRSKVSAPFGDQVFEKTVQGTVRVSRRRTVGLGI